MATAFPHVYDAGAGAFGLPMPAETTAKPKHETWRDPPWSRPDDPEPEHLVTREELLAQLRWDGYPVADRTLRSWQQSGLVPRPVRRWHEGRPAALYPAWVEDLVLFALALKAGGTPIDEVREVVRRISWGDREMLTHVPLSTAGERKARIASNTAAARRMAEVVTEVARLHEQMFGSPILDARVQFVSGHGGRWEYRIKLDPPTDDQDESAIHAV